MSRCRAVDIGAPVGCVHCGNCEVDFPSPEPDYDRDEDYDCDECDD